MYLSDLCTATNAVFLDFVGFPQLYPPKTKTPWNVKGITPDYGCIKLFATLKTFNIK